MNNINKITDLCFYKSDKIKAKEELNDKLKELLNINPKINKSLGKILEQAEKPGYVLTSIGLMGILFTHHEAELIRYNIRQQIKKNGRNNK